ncbi:MAG: hypothetical protein ACK5Z5_05790, partial [Neisseriaceae bacterium]
TSQPLQKHNIFIYINILLYHIFALNVQRFHTIINANGKPIPSAGLKKAAESRFIVKNAILDKSDGVIVPISIIKQALDNECKVGNGVFIDVCSDNEIRVLDLDQVEWAKNSRLKLHKFEIDAKGSTLEYNLLNQELAINGCHVTNATINADKCQFSVKDFQTYYEYKCKVKGATLKKDAFEEYISIDLARQIISTGSSISKIIVTGNKGMKPINWDEFNSFEKKSIILSGCTIDINKNEISFYKYNLLISGRCTIKNAVINANETKLSYAKYKEYIVNGNVLKNVQLYQYPSEKDLDNLPLSGARVSFPGIELQHFELLINNGGAIAENSRINVGRAIISIDTFYKASANKWTLEVSPEERKSCICRYGAHSYYETEITKGADKNVAISLESVLSLLNKMEKENEINHNPIDKIYDQDCTISGPNGTKIKTREEAKELIDYLTTTGKTLTLKKLNDSVIRYGRIVRGHIIDAEKSSITWDLFKELIDNDCKVQNAVLKVSDKTISCRTFYKILSMESCVCTFENTKIPLGSIIAEIKSELSRQFLTTEDSPFSTLPRDMILILANELTNSMVKDIYSQGCTIIITGGNKGAQEAISKDDAYKLIYNDIENHIYNVLRVSTLESKDYNKDVS